MTPLHDLVQSLFDLRFPPRCVACGGGGAVLCAACRATIRAPAPPLRARCGRSLMSRPPSSPSTTLCPSCAAGHHPRSLTSITAASVYEGAVRQAIHAFKFAGRRRLAEPLGALLATAARRLDVRPDLIFPVPLHPNRRKERGYNHAELLARRCAARLGVPCRVDLLMRTRTTPPQVGLSLVERQANVRAAFSLATGAGRASAGKRILGIDDVATTGSTLDAAGALLGGGAAAPAAVVGRAVSRPDLADDMYDADGQGLAKHACPPRTPYDRAAAHAGRTRARRGGA